MKTCVRIYCLRPDTGVLVWVADKLLPKVGDTGSIDEEGVARRGGYTVQDHTVVVVAGVDVARIIGDDPGDVSVLLVESAFEAALMCISQEPRLCVSTETSR